MNKIVVSIAVLVILVVGGVGVWLIAPLFYDKEVSEEIPEGFEDMEILESLTPIVSSGPTKVEVEQTAIARNGSFVGADDFHQASGTARILEAEGKSYVRFEDDFSVTNGPDLYVYFGNDGQYDADTNLGRLKGSKGSQNYEIPGEIDVSQFNEVHVWCRAFSVPFGRAKLN